MAAGTPYGDAEVLFKNRLLSRSLVKYKTVAPSPTGKENEQHNENEQPEENDQIKENDELKDGKKQKDSKKSKDPEKAKESKKGKKEKVVEAETVEEPKQEEPQNDVKQDEPLFSRLDVKKITPYFVTT
jgi:hypothetical protein